MYEKTWGVNRIHPKWFNLLKAVKSKELTTSHCLIQVQQTCIIAMDGCQALKIDRDVDWDIKAGFYLLSSDHFLIPAVKSGLTLDNCDAIFELKEQDKTATIKFGIGQPLVAIAQAIQAFNCIVNIDMFRKSLQALEDLQPDFARIYGFKDKELAAKKPLLMEFSIQNVTVKYAVMPFNPTEELLTIDDMPLFKTKKAS